MQLYRAWSPHPRRDQPWLSQKIRCAALKLFYEGRFGDLVADHTGGIKVSLPF